MYKLISVALLSLATTQAFAGTCDIIEPISISQPTGSKLSNSSNSYATSATYSNGQNVEIKGSFNIDATSRLWETIDTIAAVNINGSFFAMNNQGWQPWDGRLETLPARSTVSAKSSQQTISIFDGQLPAGSYQVYFGYKQHRDLIKGNCFGGYYISYSTTPITISVK